MQTRQDLENGVKGKRYVLYLPANFKATQNREIIKKVTTVAKKLFKGATISSQGIGVFVSKNEKNEFKEFEEPVRTIEIISTDTDGANLKIEQLAYAVLCAIDERHQLGTYERAVWFTEQDIVLHELQNPDWREQ